MPVIVLAGPTGTGKTALSLEVAAAIGGEVVNADAMQLYRGMDVGTAKLPVADRRGIPHHVFDLWDVTEPASVAVYRDAARAAVEAVEARGAVPVIVGGSGLYLEAVLRDLAFAPVDAALRARLEAEAARDGGPATWQRLAAVDAEAAARIPAGNVRRVIRALEVVTLTGRPYAASLPTEAPWWRPARRFRIEAPGEVLAPRLAERARRMWQQEGLLDEVAGLLDAGLREGTTASRAIGYAQAIAVLDGRSTAAEGLAETIRLTWRMVRRQRAWLGRDPGMTTLDGTDPADALRGVLAAVDGSAPESPIGGP